MTTAQVVETSVTVNNNSPIQDYVHLDDQTQPTFDTKYYLILAVNTTQIENENDISEKSRRQKGCRNGVEQVVETSVTVNNNNKKTIKKTENKN